MKIIFCNITYMNEYVGNIDRDMPHGGGLYVKQYNDAHEQWNFLNYNGECLGFTQIQGEEFHIERIDGVKKSDTSVDDVTVVWCANKQNGETVIVGWYEHATVYRYYENTILTPAFGLERSYFTKADADNCYLMPESKRTFKIPRSSIEGKGKGMGRSNIWYAESSYAREILINDVLKYMEKNRGYRINTLNEAFDKPANLNIPTTDKEKLSADRYYEDSEYVKFIPLGYRIFEESQSTDDLFYVATALREAYQFDKSAKIFEELCEKEGDLWDTSSTLPYLYALGGDYRKAIASAHKLLNFEECKDNYTRIEVYSIIADNNYNIGNLDEAVKWLDKIIAESENKDIAEHAKNVKYDWMDERQ